MAILRGDHLTNRGIGSSNSCDLDREDEDAISVQGSLEVIEPLFTNAVLDVVEVVDACAMEAIASSLISRRAVRFFVSAPGRRTLCSAVGFISQGNTTLLECQAEANHLFSIIGHSVDVIHNTASFGWSSRNISLESDSVILLRNSWRDYFDGIRSPNALRLQFCAGDGAYIVRAALQGYEHAQRIFVVVTAPSCVIDPVLCFCVRHYRAAGDLTSLGFGPGSHYPEFSVVPRHGESRGTIDSFFDSSTFMELLRLEGLCFYLRHVLLQIGQLPDHYDQEVQNLRTQYLSDSRSGIQCFRPVNLRIDRQRALADFLSRYGGNGRVSCLENLVEAALDEYPREPREYVLFIIHLLRETFCIGIETGCGILSRKAFHIPYLAIGVPVLQILNRFRRGGVYVVPRNQGQNSVLRRLALRGYLFDVVCFLYEVGITCSFLISNQNSAILACGLGGYISVMGFNLVIETIFRFYSPLRGRVQRFLTVVNEEDIETVRMENAAAQRLGMVERVFRGVSQIAREAAWFIIGGSVVYQLSQSFTQSSAEDNIGLSSTQSGKFNPAITGMIVIGVSGLVSVASLIGNLCQIRRIVSRLRRSQSSEGVPLVELGRTHRVPRLQRLSEREDVGGSESNI